MYQYFANREMLLAALLEREMLEAELLVRAALAPPRQGPLAELLGDVLAALAAHFESHAGMVSKGSPPSRRRWRRTRSRTCWSPG